MTKTKMNLCSPFHILFSSPIPVQHLQHKGKSRVNINMRYSRHEAWEEQKGEPNLTSFATGYDLDKGYENSGVALFTTAKITHSKALWCFLQLYNRCLPAFSWLPSPAHWVLPGQSLPLNLPPDCWKERLHGSEVLVAIEKTQSNKVCLKAFWIKIPVLPLCSKEAGGFAKAYIDPKWPGGNSIPILQVYTSASRLGCSLVPMALPSACSSPSS